MQENTTEPLPVFEFSSDLMSDFTNYLKKTKDFAHLSDAEIRRLFEQYSTGMEVDKSFTQLYAIFMEHKFESESFKTFIRQESIVLTPDILPLIEPNTVLRQLEEHGKPIWQFAHRDGGISSNDDGAALLQCSTAQTFILNIQEKSKHQHRTHADYHCFACKQNYTKRVSELENEYGFKEPCPNYKSDGKTRCSGKNRPVSGGDGRFVSCIAGDAFIFIEDEYGHLQQRRVYFTSFDLDIKEGPQWVTGVMTTPANSKEPVVYVMASEEMETAAIPELVHAKTLPEARVAVEDFIAKEAHIKFDNAKLIIELMILQAIAYHLFNNKQVNMLLVGPQDLGKTFIPTYMAPVLYRPFMWTSYDSVSVPALRGSSMKMYINGKEQTMRSEGHLAVKKCIFIDEILKQEGGRGGVKTNKLLEDFKQYLLEDNVTNNKVGGSGSSPKNAVVIGAGNFSTRHHRDYKTKIKKRYDTMMGSPNLHEFATKQQFDESLDYFGDLEEYAGINPFMKKAVEETRMSYGEEHWMFGLSTPELKRFPLKIVVRPVMVDPRPAAITLFNSHNDVPKKSFEIERKLTTHSFVEYVQKLQKHTIEDPELIKTIEYVNRTVANNPSSVYSDEIDTTATNIIFLMTKSFMYANYKSVLDDETRLFVRQLLTLMRKAVLPITINYSFGEIWLKSKVTLPKEGKE